MPDRNANLMPDYRGGGIVNLMASLQAGLGGRPGAYAPLGALPAAEIRAHRRVLLLVIDGLGFDYLQEQAGALWLQRHVRSAITSVYPPTTAAAVTTFLTGDAPQQHAMTGWFIRFPELEQVYAVLPGYPRGRGPDLATRTGGLARFLGHTPFSSRIAAPSDLVSPSAIAYSPYNLAHRGAARLHAFEDLEGLVAVCARLLRAPGRGYVYAYWPGLDEIGHRHGIRSAAARRHLLELDAALERLCDAARNSGALLLVTADHGQLDTVPERRLDLGAYPEIVDCLAGPLSGEPRSAYCHVKARHRRRFVALVREQLAAAADLYRSEELVAAGWFGLGAPHPQLTARLGDFVLVLRDGYALFQHLPGEPQHVQIGVHGGRSAAELWVPLAVASL